MADWLERDRFNNETGYFGRAHERLLHDFEKVYIFADGDQPGSEFAKLVSKEIQNTVILQMPDGEDVNSMFLQVGAGYFQQKLAAA